MDKLDYNVNIDWEKVNWSRRLLSKAWNHQIPDRIPLNAQNVNQLKFGYDYPTYFNNYESMLYVQLKSIEDNINKGFDCLPGVHPDLYGHFLLVDIFGGSWKWIEGEEYPVPWFTPGIKNRQQIENLSVPDISDIKANSYAKKFSECVGFMSKNIPKEVEIGMGYYASPFSLASMLYGNTNMLEDLILAPEIIDRLLDVITDTMIKWLKIAIELTNPYVDRSKVHSESIGPVVQGPLWISSDYEAAISTNMYTRQVFKYDVKLFETLGGGHIHTCGDHGHLLPQFMQIPKVHSIEVNPTKINLEKAFIQGRGNICFIVQANTAEEAKRIIEAYPYNEGGLVLVAWLPQTWESEGSKVFIR